MTRMRNSRCVPAFQLYQYDFDSRTQFALPLKKRAGNGNGTGSGGYGSGQTTPNKANGTRLSEGDLARADAALSHRAYTPVSV